MKLKDILKDCLFTDGDWIESKDQDPLGDIRLIQLSDIGDGCFIDKSKKFVNKETAAKLRCTYLQKNDILVARMPDPLGRACLFPYEEENKYITAVDVCILRPNGSCDNRYLQYVLNSPAVRNKIDFQKTGTTRERITRKKLGELDLFFPPLETQKHIAKILDDAATLRDKTKQLLEEYDILVKSIFLDMFGDTYLNTKNWRTDKLINICTEIIDCPHSTPNYVNFKTEYPCIRTTELRNGSIDWKAMKYLDKDGYELRIKRLKPKAGDIVYGREGTIGEAVIIPQNTNFSLGQRVMLFRANNLKINSVFLHNVIRSKGLLFQAFKANAGSTVNHVNVKDVKKFKIILPPVTLQNQFAEKIALIEQQKELAKQEFKESEDLFNCLLQKAFKGELV